MNIELYKLTKTEICFSSQAGKELYEKLLKIVESDVSNQVFSLSFKKIKMIDTSFARESIVAIVKMFVPNKLFCMVDIENLDIIENINCAAKTKEQSIINWSINDGKYEILGPRITQSSRDVIDFILEQKEITTAKLSEEQSITSQNASTKIKNLYNRGCLLRAEKSSETGGIEYVYRAIK